MEDWGFKAKHFNFSCFECCTEEFVGAVAVEHLEPSFASSGNLFHHSYFILARFQ